MHDDDDDDDYYYCTTSWERKWNKNKRTVSKRRIIQNIYYYSTVLFSIIMKATPRTSTSSSSRTTANTANTATAVKHIDVRVVNEGFYVASSTTTSTTSTTSAIISQEQQQPQQQQQQRNPKGRKTRRDNDTTTTTTTTTNSTETTNISSNSNYSNNSITELKKLKLKLKTKFLHLGKAGGGSILDRMNELNFQFKYGEDHIRPTPNHYKKYESLIVSLRDPIDRMGSAWYWMRLFSCRYDKGDTRQSNNKKNRKNKSSYSSSSSSSSSISRSICNDGSGLKWMFPSKCCNIMHNVPTTFWDQYDGHAYNLAEAFCSNDPLIVQQAEEDIHKITHAGVTIVKWLGLINKSRNNNKNRNNGDGDDDGDDDDDAVKIIQNKIVATVIESGYDLNEQIDGAIEWLLNITLDGDEDKASLVFNNTIAIAKAKTKAKAKQEHQEHQKDNSTSNNNKNGEGTNIHSSNGITFPWLKDVTSITTKGSCCLARHFYKDDYLLLLNPNFSDWVCKGSKEQLCRGAISSIIERRRPILEYALYSNSPCIDIDINIGNGNGIGIGIGIGINLVKVEVDDISASAAVKTTKVNNNNFFTLQAMMLMFGMVVLIKSYKKHFSYKKEMKKN